MIDPLTDVLELLPPLETPRPSSKIVFESAPVPWPLDAVLRLRATHPTVRLLTPMSESRATRIAEAFRRGAECYIVGSGNPDVDFEFIDDAMRGRPFSASGGGPQPAAD